MKKSRNVAIAGIGQTRHRGHREDVNIAELVSEAVEEVLADSMVDLTDIDCDRPRQHGAVRGHSPAGHVARDRRRRLRQGRLPHHHRRHHRRHPGLGGRPPGGLRAVRPGPGHRLREAGRGDDHHRHHQHVLPPLGPRGPDRRHHRDHRRHHDEQIRPEGRTGRRRAAGSSWPPTPGRTSRRT